MADRRSLGTPGTLRGTFYRWGKPRGLRGDTSKGLTASKISLRIIISFKVKSVEVKRKFKVSLTVLGF